MSDLVLSLFPGIGLLDMAFEEEGFCIVRGPDLLWGGDVRRFHPPAGKFDGVIGGPPCQLFSALNNLAVKSGVVFENLIPEFGRVVYETRPAWWLMENVPAAPWPDVSGYSVDSIVLNNRWFGAVQNRKRRFTYGVAHGKLFTDNGRSRGRASLSNPWRRLEVSAFEPVEYEPAVTAAHAGERRVHNRKPKIRRYTAMQAARLQGLPDDFLAEAPLTAQGRLKVIAQGVPLPMGRAIARAVKIVRCLEMHDVD